jgi:hypothetical protein
MTPALTSMRRYIGAAGATLAGVAYFFVIIGVFGLLASIIALLLFIAVALLAFGRSQSERGDL